MEPCPREAGRVLSRASLLRTLPLIKGQAWDSGYLSQQEGDHVRRLPVAGVEEVGQGHGGEGRQGVGAVQGIVDPLLAPPLRSNCQEEGTVTGLGPRGSPGPSGLAPPKDKTLL